VVPAPSSVQKGFRAALDEVLALIFPPRCVACGDFERSLCDDCRARLESLGERGCRRCGGARGAGLRTPYCSECLVRPPTFEQARSAFIYRGPARDLVQALKAGARRELGSLMGDLALPAFADFVGPLPKPLVTWVPSHRSVERRRGYNQAELLARRLAKLSGLPVKGLLAKPSATSHQQGLDRKARQANLREAFVLRARPEAKLDSEGVVIVDDVYTTGATAGEVAAVIKRELAVPVYVFTFCRTPLAGGLTVD
jgi:ComF family protein